MDSSAWLDYVDRATRTHEAVCEALERYGKRLVTSNFVFDEAMTLSRTRLGHDIAVMLGTALTSTEVTDLLRVTPDDEKEALNLFLKRPDKSYSFTDYTSFVMMRRLGIRLAITLDTDFASEGFEVSPGGGEALRTRSGAAWTCGSSRLDPDLQDCSA